MMTTSLRRLWRLDGGNIAISAALCAPLILYGLSLGVDYGMLTLQQRRLQATADLSAIVAASDVNNAQANLLGYFRDNNLNVALKTANGYVSNQGNLPAGATIPDGKFDGVAALTLGTYVPDPAVDMGKRFVAGAQPYDAAKVAMQQTGGLFFAASFSTPPKLKAVGTAATQKLAAFSVGSRLASLNGGLLNAILNGLLGTSLSLKAMDYQALASVNVNLLSTIDALATNLNLTAGSYSDVLDTEISYGDLIKGITGAAGLSGTASQALQTIQKAVNTLHVKLKLSDILALGPTRERMIGSGSHLDVEASVLDLISAAAVAADGGKQIAVNLDGTIPGLSTVKLTLAIGEPPQGTPPLAVGAPGSVVRTAQTRLKLEISVDGLAAIAGMKIRIPLYIEVAYAEAKLANITCFGGGPQNGSVAIDAVPGVAEVALGDVDTSIFANFSDKPRVTPAALIDSALLKVTAGSDINITNMSKSKLTFSPTDIASKLVKTVSTRDTLTSTVQSLLKNTDFDIKILFITLGAPKAIQSALADTLSGVTAPLDDLLYNLLLLLGVKIGEADVRVTDVRCQQPVLVQ